jgi:hypothetical protein
MKFLTQSDLTKIFNISNAAISELINTGKLPYQRIDDNNNMLFSPDTIIKHIIKPTMEDQKYIEKLKNRLWQENPAAMQAIKDFGSHFSDPLIPKKYYLDKVPIKNWALCIMYGILKTALLFPAIGVPIQTIKKQPISLLLKTEKNYSINIFTGIMLESLMVSYIQYCVNITQRIHRILKLTQ